MIRRIILCLFVLIKLANGQVDVDLGLQMFLTEKMNDFGPWVISNNLDPTQSIEQVFEISMTNDLFTLSGNLSDLAVTGLSTYDRISTTSSFLNGYIDIELTILHGGLTGKYNAGGLISEENVTLSIGGSGNWETSSKPLYVWFRENFYLVDGHIVLNDSVHESSAEEFWFYPYDDTIRGKFENMFNTDTAAYEKEITEQITSHLPRYVFGIEGARTLLMYRHIFNFLKPIFEATSATDIINWGVTTTTQRPTSSTSISSTSTTYVTTHQPPSTTRCIGLIQNENSVKSEGMNFFLYKIMKNFGSWLIGNGIDPTPPIVSSAELYVNSSFLQLDGIFRNTVGSGVSNELTIVNIYSDFVAPELHIIFSLTDLSIYGNYKANGTVISLYPISGEGIWEIKSSYLTFELLISGFAIDDGFININKFANQYIALTPSKENGDISMPDLITPEGADGFGQEVLDILHEVIPKMLEDQDKHPIIKSVLDYLKFQFSIHPLSEIITTPYPC